MFKRVMRMARGAGRSPPPELKTRHPHEKHKDREASSRNKPDFNDDLDSVVKISLHFQLPKKARNRQPQ